MIDTLLKDISTIYCVGAPTITGSEWPPKDYCGPRKRTAQVRQAPKQMVLPFEKRHLPPAALK